jgi:hypothetical protein
MGLAGKNRRDNRHSVILPDISIGFVEEILIRVQLVLQERPPEFFLHQTLALRRVLPVRKANFLHDVVDVRDNAFDDDVRIAVLRFLEELGQRFSGAVALLFRVGVFLGLNDVPGDVKDLFEELQADKEALLVTRLDLLQALAQGGELWMPVVFTQAGDQFDLDFPGALARLYVRQNLFQHLRIKHQRLEVIAHRFKVDVLVDELDGLGAQGVPQELAVATGRLYGDS